MTPAVLRAAGVRRQAMAGPAGATAFALVGCGYLALVDPYDASAPMPACLFRAGTGWQCPACGGLRMTRSLLYGDLGAAARANALLLAVLPAIVVLWGVWWVRAAHGRPAGRRLSGGATALVLTVAAAWTVARNLV